MYSYLSEHDYSIELSHLNPGIHEFLVPLMSIGNSLKITEVKKRKTCTQTLMLAK